MKNSNQAASGTNMAAIRHITDMNLKAQPRNEPLERPCLAAFQNVETTKPERQISLAGLVVQVQGPRVGPKDTAPAIAPHNGNGKTKAIAEHAMFSVVVVDLDDGSYSRDKIIQDFTGDAYLAFTTASHYQEGKGERWKVIFPLAEPVAVSVWHRLAQGAAIYACGDTSQARVQQVFFAPNKLTAGAPYDYILNLNEPYLTPGSGLGELFIDCAEDAAQAQAEVRNKPIKSAGGSSPAMARAAARVNLPSLLQQHGYERVQGRWLRPGASSNKAGVVLLTGDDKPRVYSHHSDADPLSHENHYGHALDAIDVLAVLAHGGDIGAALASLRPGYDALLVEAQGLQPDSDLELIKGILEEASYLDSLEQSRIHKCIRDQCGFTAKNLKDTVAEAKAKDGLDDLGVALRVAKHIGEVDLMADKAQLWHYQKGVWTPYNHRAERSVIQDTMAGSNMVVKKSRIDGAADALRNQFYRPGHEWDVGNTEAVSVQNGLLVLEKGAWNLKPHCREDYRTSQLPIEFDAEAKAPRFKKFLAEIFEGDDDAPDKARVVLEMMGYTLMAHAKREKYIVLKGKPGTGKSKILQVISALCGKSHRASVKPSQMTSDYFRAGLQGKLINVVTELAEGSKLPDAEIKSLVTGEASEVRSIYGHPFNLEPYATVWIATNHMPTCRDYTGAVQDRTIIVSCDRQFRNTDAEDVDLVDKLRAELPGVLNLALAAYAEVVARTKFTDPASSIAAKNQWALENDQVARFVDECCVLGSGAVVTSELYKVYRGWADDEGIGYKLGKNAFSMRICECPGVEHSRNKIARSLANIKVA